MAHLLAPQPPNPEIPIFFNVDQVVGQPPASNLREDIILVQFLYVALGPHLVRDLDLKNAAMQVRCTGVMDQATLTAIKVHQQSLRLQNPGVVVDGRVSPAKGYNYGGITWLIVVLNEAVQHYYLDIWPRIDQIPGCPNEIWGLVIRTVQGI